MAFRQFNHLNVPEYWERYWTKYPQGLTILEGLMEWVSQVDGMVDNVNDWNDYLDEFVKTFDENLRETVIAILKEWQADGTLDIIISDALQTQADNIQKDVDDRGINVLKYPTVKDDKTTDNTAAIQTIINGLTLPNTIFIPKNVKWNYANITHPNELIILDHSRYDARNDFWGAQRKVYAKTDSPETKNANEEIYLAPYHPALVVDNVGKGLEEKRASVIFRQDGTSMWRVGKGAYVDDDTFVIAEFPTGSTAFSILHGSNKEMGFGGLPLKNVAHFFKNGGEGPMVERYQTGTGTETQFHF